MANVRGSRKALEAALASQDPHRLAQVFALPIDNGAIKRGEAKKHNLQSLAINGKDYGKLMTALMDAVAATEVVSDRIDAIGKVGLSKPSKLICFCVFYCVATHYH